MAFTKTTATSLACIALLTAVPVAAQTPSYQVTEIGDSSLVTPCVATALNDAGITGGSCAQAVTATINAASWNRGVKTNLGMLPNGHYALATAINSLGVTVGDADAGDWQPRPFVTYNGRLLNIDPSGGANMRAIGIMDDGTIFGNYAKGLSGNTSAWSAVYYLPEPGKPDRYRRYELPRVAGGDSKSNGVYANASNKSGQVAGMVQNSLVGQRGAFWNNDAAHTVVTLQPLEGGSQSIAWGINDLGQAVGGSWTPFVGDRAVMWNNDAAHTPIDLGVLPGDISSTAIAANAAGQVIGVSVSPANERRAFLSQAGAMLDLASLIAPEDGAWTIQQVFAINNSGQILAVGIGNGRVASLLLTPVAR
jgi:probable HAF family extracellular repeat protein